MGLCAIELLAIKSVLQGRSAVQGVARVSKEASGRLLEETLGESHKDVEIVDKWLLESDPLGDHHDLSSIKMKVVVLARFFLCCFCCYCLPQ